jgi:hypothetical protein
VGTVAHPPIIKTNITKKIFCLFIMSLLLIVRRSRRRNYLHPAIRTLFNIRIIIQAIRAEIPVSLFLLLWLDIYRRLFPINRRRPIIIIIGIRIAWPTPPPWAPSTPSWTNPDTSTKRGVPVPPVPPVPRCLCR